MENLIELLNKVINKNGLLKVPSYWIHKLFKDILQWIDNRFAKTDESIISNKTDVLNKIADIGNEIDVKFAELENKKLDKESPLYSYAELKTLRDEEKLIPGHTYRMEYKCIINHDRYRSTGDWSSIFGIIVEHHQLSTIILTAIDSNVFSEDAIGYSFMEQFRLKYCFDNDANRFSWASEEGNGVVYWMQDKYFNECPYDFTNIGTIERREVYNTTGLWNVLYPTFGYYSSPISQLAIGSKCHHNIIKAAYNSNGVQILNFVFTNLDDDQTFYNNIIDTNCNNIYFIGGSYNNHIESGCSVIHFRNINNINSVPAHNVTVKCNSVDLRINSNNFNSLSSVTVLPSSHGVLNISQDSGNIIGCGDAGGGWTMKIENLISQEE